VQQKLLISLRTKNRRIDHVNLAPAQSRNTRFDPINCHPVPRRIANYPAPANVFPARIALRLDQHPCLAKRSPNRRCYNCRVKISSGRLVGKSVLTTAAAVALLGCGSAPRDCSGGETLQILPATATLNHSAASPGNSQQFTAYQTETPVAGCRGMDLSPFPIMATWSVSDPIDVSINPTTGIAVCKAPTKGPVTITGSGGGSESATALLICD
jgi:hypothetical protein